jgi:hypothetical protein
MVFGRKPLKTRVFVSSCPGNPPVVSVRFFHQFRESLLKAVFSRLYGGYFRPEKTELHRASPSFYTKSPRSAEVRRGPPRSVSFYTRSRKSEKSEKFQEVMVRRPSSFASESSITTNPLAHAGENPLSYQAPP